MTKTIALATALLFGGITYVHAEVDRTLERTFPVTSLSSLSVDVANGPIRVSIGEPGEIVVRLYQTARDEDQFARYQISATAKAQKVTLVAKAEKYGSWKGPWHNQVKFRTEIVVPADTTLDLDTAGGSILVNGMSQADIRADTSGGRIDVDGSTGSLDLDTSGGAIRVGKVYGNIRADTSGGSIKIVYVGPEATNVYADTSGGSITIGVDATAKFDLEADTSGGSVRVLDLNFNAHKVERSYARGKINDGGGELHADTSGGSITIQVAKARS